MRAHALSVRRSSLGGGCSLFRRRHPEADTISKSERGVFETWRELSQFVHRHRHGPEAAASNPVLRGAIDADPDGLLAPLLLLWEGDNLRLEGRLDDAIGSYDELLARYPDRRFGGGPYAENALLQIAECHEFAGRFEQAAATYQRALGADPVATSQAWLIRELGRTMEKLGRFDAAIETYRRGADAPDEPSQTMVAIPELARRDAERLERDRVWVRPAEDLASELAEALESRNTEILAQLASPTHFTFGLVGSERRFVDPGPLVSQLDADLARSEVTVDRAHLGGSGGKLYLTTRGWSGSYFTGAVELLLTRAPGGFEWGGIAPLMQPVHNGEGPDLPEFPEDPPDLPADPPAGKGSKPTSPPVTPATLGMKAPWPSGEFFRAGGIAGFTAQLASYVALAAPFGPLSGLVLTGLIETASLATPCGFGPGGLFYGQPTTHVDRDTFAIDFSRFLQGVPLWLDALGKPVLAVADGIVTSVRSSITRGDPSIENRVDIGHMTEIEILMAFLIEWLTGQPVAPKYSSEYLHLDGPGLVPVSLGMILKQGARLGLVDDTGLSVADHLHFSLHDRDLTFSADSVRPTPMDGQTLNDWDDGRCMFSTNIPIP